MDIENLHLGIRYPIGDWGFLSQVKKSKEEREQIPNSQFDETSPIGGYLKYLIRDIIPDWLFHSVNPVMRWTFTKKYIPKGVFPTSC